MRLVSLCDGIGTAHLAAEGLGWEHVGSSEVDPACLSVLGARFPSLPQIGDMTAPTFPEMVAALRPDVLMASTPCQSFSTIGQRKADDPRGLLIHSLTLVYARTLPRWLVWENVVGALSTDSNAFGKFLAGLLGDGLALPEPRGGWPTAGAAEGPRCRLAWRVIDSQGFVPQRRRRLFLVAAREGRDPVATLFEPRADAPTPEAVSAWIEAGRKASGDTLAFDWMAAGAGNDTSFGGGSRRWVVRPPGQAGTIRASGVDAVLHGGRVRRLTATEQSLLMGFPPDYLDVVHAGKPLSAARKGRMLGNAIVLPVLRWLFRSISGQEDALLE